MALSTIKTDQILLYSHFYEIIIKEPGTSFQSAVLRQKHTKNVFIQDI